MTTWPQRPTPAESWQRHLMLAASCAGIGLVAHLAGPLLPPPLAMVGLGIGLIGASFLLAWAADAGDAVFHGGLVLAVIALVTVLPEFIIEVRFAFIQQTELVTANMTGATRLLLVGAIALPLLVAFLSRRRGQGATVSYALSANRRLELAILAITAVFAIQIVARGALTVFDGAILIGFYVLYARRVQGTPDEDPAVIGVAAGLLSLPAQFRRPAIAGLVGAAAAVVIVVANPFTDALLETGTGLGIDPYLLIQSVVPLATEFPEFVVVAVLVANRRPAQGLALLLAASVSQCTLAMGTLPFAYMAGGGGMSLPLAGREQVELGFTIGLALFVVAALVTLRPERVDALLIACVFVVQILHPTSFVRAAAAFVLLVFAIDLLLSRRRAVRPMLRAAVGQRGTG